MGFLCSPSRAAIFGVFLGMSSRRLLLLLSFVFSVGSCRSLSENMTTPPNCCFCFFKVPCPFKSLPPVSLLAHACVGAGPFPPRFSPLPRIETEKAKKRREKERAHHKPPRRSKKDAHPGLSDLSPSRLPFHRRPSPPPRMCMSVCPFSSLSRTKYTDGCPRRVSISVVVFFSVIFACLSPNAT